MLKRYLLFAFNDYYPAGGWDDFVESFDTIDEAKSMFMTTNKDLGHIFDGDIGRVIVETDWTRAPHTVWVARQSPIKKED